MNSYLSRFRVSTAAMVVVFLSSFVLSEAVIFSNLGTITINDSPAGSSTSTINVSGLDPFVSTITVTIFGYQHSLSTDVQIALQNVTTGQSVMLMGQAGPGAQLSPGPPPVYGPAQTSVNITFDDGAGAFLPIGGTTLIADGSYKPTQDTGLFDFTGGPNPPTTTTWSTTLAAFNGGAANGDWKLWVQDFYAGDSGSISGGWQVDITATAVPEPHEYAMIAGVGLLGFAVFRRLRAVKAPALQV